MYQIQSNNNWLIILRFSSLRLQSDAICLASEILQHADPFDSVTTVARGTMRASGLHPTDWVSFEIITAIAVGIVESDRLSAQNQPS